MLRLFRSNSAVRKAFLISAALTVCGCATRTSTNALSTREVTATVSNVKTTDVKRRIENWSFEDSKRGTVHVVVETVGTIDKMNQDTKSVDDVKTTAKSENELEPSPLITDSISAILNIILGTTTGGLGLLVINLFRKLGGAKQIIQLMSSFTDKLEELVPEDEKTMTEVKSIKESHRTKAIDKGIQRDMQSYRGKL